MTNSSLRKFFFLALFDSMARPQYRDELLLKAIATVCKEYRALQEVHQEGVNTDVKENTKISFHMGRIEAGKTNYSVSTLTLICDYFKVSLSTFMKKVEKEKESLEKCSK